MVTTAECPGQRYSKPAERLADRDAAADGRIAGSAATALHQVADHRDQLVGRQAAPAHAAMGRWPQQRLPSWNTIEHDFEEATQRRPERKQEGCAEQVAHDVHQWQFLPIAPSVTP